jgi:hypothetical protein
VVRLEGITQGSELPNDLLYGLIPGDRLPLGSNPLTLSRLRPLQRGKDPLRVIQDLKADVTARTNLTFRNEG